MFRAPLRFVYPSNQAKVKKKQRFSSSSVSEASKYRCTPTSNIEVVLCHSQPLLCGNTLMPRDNFGRVDTVYDAILFYYLTYTHSQVAGALFRIPIPGRSPRKSVHKQAALLSQDSSVFVVPSSFAKTAESCYRRRTSSQRSSAAECRMFSSTSGNYKICQGTGV